MILHCAYSEWWRFAKCTVTLCCQANTQYVENEIEKLNGDQLLELKVLPHVL